MHKLVFKRNSFCLFKKSFTTTKCAYTIILSDSITSNEMLINHFQFVSVNNIYLNRLFLVCPAALPLLILPSAERGDAFTPKYPLRPVRGDLDTNPTKSL